MFVLQDLSVNSFEQLCINYANEQLQQFVNKALVTQEQVCSGLTICVSAKTVLSNIVNYHYNRRHFTGPH